MATGSGAFSARPFNLRVDATVNWQNGAQASVHVNMWIDKTAYSPSFSNNPVSTANASVQNIGSGAWGPAAFDFQAAGPWLLTSTDLLAPVNSDGGMLIQGSANFAVLGTASLAYWLFGAPLNAPPAPTMLQPTNITTTSMRVNWTSNGDGGSAITSSVVQYATDAAFTQNPVTIFSGGTSDLTGLTPGTTYYMRARQQNAIGVSAWSNVVSQPTIPATPPGLSVVAGPSGQDATLTFTPPGGVTGVTRYDWERRVTGTTTPVSTGSSTTTVAPVSGLIPGTSYDWRASAWIGTYQSPWSAWTTLIQPRPNVSAGDFFDGSTPDTDDIDYSWVGTPGLSTSGATAQVPIGWKATPAGGTAVMFRATAGLFGTFAARVSVIADATANGSRFGQDPVVLSGSDVTSGALYVGSIHARISRANRVAAELTFLNASLGVISRVVGTATSLSAGVWTRFSAQGVSPAGAEWAVINLIDVAGAGSSFWRGGDIIDLDGAMVTLSELFPYFDGDTADNSQFNYSWVGGENESVSFRALVATSVPDSGGGLVDPDCAPIPAPPRPPTVPVDCIDDVGLWRRYYAAIPSTVVSDWLDAMLSLEMETGPIAARQVRIRVYPNPFNYPPSQIDTNQWCSEQIISFVPPSTVFTLDGVTQRAWAEVNGGAAQSADHLLYGSNGAPATWPILSCGIGYVASFEVPLDAPEGNIATRLFLTTRT